MGLFDFFSRGASGKGQSGTDPRCDHYSFAHVVLRKAAFENPTKCVTSLASPDGKAYLSELWNEVVETCKQHNQPIELTLDDILIHKLRVGPFPCTILEMPAPHFATEAFFVGLILTVDITDQSQNMSDGSVRFFTLENGEPTEEEVQTVIGEWSADGRHTTLGPGPYPDLSDFVARITDVVTQPSLPD
ncbi:MAG: hypothetical protein ACI8P0_000328 [Planctomycetaceae bacterium]|jgi:hypothetical protein